MLSQKVELNYQTEDQFHIHVQFLGSYNLPNYQCDSQKFDIFQVQMGMMKMNLDFQNDMILKSNQ